MIEFFFGFCFPFLEEQNIERNNYNKNALEFCFLLMCFFFFL